MRIFRARALAICCALVFAATTSTAGHTAPLTMSWVGQLALHIKPCWHPPAGIGASDAIEARVMFSLEPDGTVRGKPELVDVTKHDLSKAFVESIFAAITRCQPYAFLPAEEYKGGWDKLDMTFSTDAAMRAPSRLKSGPRTFDPAQLQKAFREPAKRNSGN